MVGLHHWHKDKHVTHGIQRCPFPPSNCTGDVKNVVVKQRQVDSSMVMPVSPFLLAAPEIDCEERRAPCALCALTGGQSNLTTASDSTSDSGSTPTRIL